jgi:predicted ArsR family transcriptional regulator
MSALPENIVPFQLPKKPRVKQREPEPDQRKVCVLPMRALSDPAVSDGMLRALALLCSFCNRAGITWVSQKRMAQDGKVTQQAISKNLTKLQAAGYVQVVKKGWRGERATTWRVVYDPTVDTETAIAVTSAIEDTRPPAIKQEQAMEVDRAGQQRIAQMLAKALKNPNPKKEYAMPKSGETRAVRQIKEANAKARSRRSSSTTSEVVHQEPVDKPHSQPLIYNQSTTPEVVQNTENTVGIESIKVKSINNLNTVLHNQEVTELTNAGLTEADIADSLATLLPLFQAEGITPTSRVLADGILQLHRDAKRA